ncbi:M16 family metallopeptidase [Streptomyces cavernae]|uniref:M16 family metallopeptidase n=1 Tax=Streptomyces cavernae TaxID=2259034 RepID=UPI000FEBA808|nr:pitrilysin family protein [Streptomyces cavernae]
MASLIVEEDERRPTTTIGFVVDFGSRHDPPGRGGTAHLLEHLLISARIDGGPSLCERVARLGGQVNATTGLDRMFFQAQVLAGDVAEVIGLMGTALLQPHIDEPVMESERRAVLQELAAAAADPMDQVQEAFLAAVFPGHGLGRPVGGTAEEIRDASVATVMDVYDSVFLRRRMVLVSVGGTSPAELGKLADATPLAGLPVTDTLTPDDEPLAPLPPPAPPAPPGQDKDGFSWLAIGGRCPAADDPRRHAYTVLAHLLGSSPGSLLYRRLRAEEGLVYAYYAWGHSYRETGAWRVLAGVENRNLLRAQTVLREVLAGIAADGPEPRDLATARRQAAMEVVLDSEKPWEHTVQLGHQTLLGTRPWDVRSGMQALEQVSSEDVQAAAASINASLVTVVRPEPS